MPYLWPIPPVCGLKGQLGSSERRVSWPRSPRRSTPRHAPRCRSSIWPYGPRGSLASASPGTRVSSCPAADAAAANDIWVAAGHLDGSWEARWKPWLSLTALIFDMILCSRSKSLLIAANRGQDLRQSGSQHLLVIRCERCRIFFHPETAILHEKSVFREAHKRKKKKKHKAKEKMRSCAGRHAVPTSTG